ncbi:MAG: OmpH family outer membrane protein [Alphaproteobacteria bacterium]|nr:OmpH family outer membrane protein [Alphaproteobacteria bacterium]
MHKPLWLAVALAGFLGVSGSAYAAETPPVAKGAAAQAQTFPAPVIAIVDVQRILEESLAAKTVQQQLESQRAKFQNEISGDETGLRQAEQELAKSRDSVSPDVFADKEQQLRQKFLKVERRVQVRRKALDQAFTDSMNVVKKNLLDIVSAIARERGVNMALVKQQALWSDKRMDITDEVLARLNKALPQVQVKVAPEEDEKPLPAKPRSGLLKKQGR